MRRSRAGRRVRAVARLLTVKRSLTRRIRKLGTRRNAALGTFGTMLVVIGLLFASTPTARAYSTSVTHEVRSTTGGGGDGRGDCATGNSGSILYSVVAEGVSFDGNTLTYVQGKCMNLTSSGLQGSTWTSDLGPWGSSRSYGPVEISCHTSPWNYGIIGAIVYKTPGGYVRGIALRCGTLPAGTWSYNTGVLGWTSGTSETISSRSTAVDSSRTLSLSRGCFLSHDVWAMYALR